MIAEDFQDIAKDIAADYFRNNPIVIQLQNGLREFEKLQQTMMNLAEYKDEKMLLAMKAGTAITWEIILGLVNGKHPKDYTNEDWAELFKNVVEEAVNEDPKEYSKKVFLIYANYIEISAAAMESATGKDVSEKIENIKALADEIRIKADELDKGIISETKYIDECLWTALEAMIKLLSAYAGRFMDESAGILLEGITQYAFEYGRLALYQQEQALLDDIIAHQEQVDEKLQEKYDAYIAALDEKTAEFKKLIENAFDSDFRAQLKGAVALAKAVGVDETEILDTIEKIDDFFC